MSDPKQILAAKTLHKLDDGVAGRVIDKALQEVLRDCEERPGLNKKRTVTLQIELVPLADDRSHALRGVDTTVSVTSKIPATGMRTEFLHTTHDAAKGEVRAALVDAWQDGIDFESNEGKGN